MFCHAKYSGKPCKYWGVRDRIGNDDSPQGDGNQEAAEFYERVKSGLEMMILRKETETLARFQTAGISLLNWK